MPSEEHRERYSALVGVECEQWEVVVEAVWPLEVDLWEVGGSQLWRVEVGDPGDENVEGSRSPRESGVSTEDHFQRLVEMEGWAGSQREAGGTGC